MQPLTYQLSGCPRCQGAIKVTDGIPTCANCGYENYDNLNEKADDTRGPFQDYVDHVTHEWVKQGRKYRGSKHIEQTGFIGDPKDVLLKLLARMASVTVYLKHDESYIDGDNTLDRLEDLLPVIYNQVESNVEVVE